MKVWLRDCSYILLAVALWLVSMAIPPSSVVQARQPAGAVAGVSAAL